MRRKRKRNRKRSRRKKRNGTHHHQERRDMIEERVGPETLEGEGGRKMEDGEGTHGRGRARKSMVDKLW